MLCEAALGPPRAWFHKQVWQRGVLCWFLPPCVDASFTPCRAASLELKPASSCADTQRCQRKHPATSQCFCLVWHTLQLCRTAALRGEPPARLRPSNPPRHCLTRALTHYPQGQHGAEDELHAGAGSWVLRRGSSGVGHRPSPLGLRWLRSLFLPLL